MLTTKKISKFRYQGGQLIKAEDAVIVEQPLQIVISASDSSEKPIVYTITYRTPGEDQNLITGLLLSEGVIYESSDIETLEIEPDEQNYNSWHVHLSSSCFKNLEQEQKFQPTYSSCGLCGNTSIKKFESKHDIHLSNSVAWLEPALINNYAVEMKSKQEVFKQTGGVHAASLFDQHGNMIALKEDIGRHNALDKLIGFVANNKTDFNYEHSIIVISSRISLEMVQKALVAGAPVLIAVGGASNLAIDAAIRFGLTLIGFVSTKGFNVYSGHQRLK